ncbi:uncharacterized protein [Arachis hypogaea]|uniref:uncharacterized protein n=1 Tax=Arachis hypogaea TaxID=3818 RepID=UPI003B21D787
MARATTYHQFVTGMEAHDNRIATSTEIHGNGVGPSNRSPGIRRDTIATTNSIPQPIAFYEPTINNTTSHANINEIRHHVRTFHNCARNFQENTTVLQTTLPTTKTCTHCNAHLFHHETFDMCCNGGKVSLPKVNAPQELLEIFLDPSVEGNHFRKHIHGYNYVFSFTSCGVHIDEQLATSSHGIYTFRAQGSMYHSIGRFHPDQGAHPRFLQLYIYDTAHELQIRMLDNTQLHESLVLKLQQLLHRYNSFIHVFRQLAQRLDVQECSLVIRERPANQPQYSLPTASQVAAIIVGDDIETMIRPDDHSTVLQVGRLLQQYDVDNYVKMETENVGRRTILPSSFVSSRRDMTQWYEDGMAIVLKEGKPDIFLTMTCNPSWSEKASKLSPTQTPHDRLDLTTRIFRAKFEQLNQDDITKGVLKKVKSYIYVTEFQKRGLSHVHMLLILENNDKLSDLD